MGSFPVTACSSQRGSLLRFSVQSLKDVHIVEIWQIVMVCSNALEDDYRRPAGLGPLAKQLYFACAIDSYKSSRRGTDSPRRPCFDL